MIFHLLIFALAWFRFRFLSGCRHYYAMLRHFHYYGASDASPLITPYFLSSLFSAFFIAIADTLSPLQALSRCALRCRRAEPALIAALLLLPEADAPPRLPLMPCRAALFSPFSILFADIAIYYWYYAATPLLIRFFDIMLPLITPIFRRFRYASYLPLPFSLLFHACSSLCHWLILLPPLPPLRFRCQPCRFRRQLRHCAAADDYAIFADIFAFDFAFSFASYYAMVYADAITIDFRCYCHCFSLSFSLALRRFCCCHTLPPLLLPISCH